ncbi:conserved hypothetical protein [Candidatus Terasakiella magnetica]|uniref:Pentapeptide repeat-containing protein n=1 Tax=Candidatus Terasakiella magnetica TaxID=1867952 RepID=A0A1C3RH29_9PROT|nr:pentapeptide repeat-containing protein [Candidatus Terasakiella magnetica]SCA56601.1 conserved hypothetical protein [Candidatus Terasakiella magnetica]
MSNVYHLQNLGKGSTEWNAWRESEKNVTPDLSHAEIKAVNLARIDLKEALLTQANLKQTNLSGGDLSGANMAGANMEGISLAGANMERANCAGVYLHKANLAGSKLRWANLSGAAVVGKSNMSGADLTGANLCGARLTGVNLSGANLTGANLAGADFRDADLTGADFTNADTSGAYFGGADLRGTLLEQYYDLFGPDPEMDEAAEEEELLAEEPEMEEPALEEDLSEDLLVDAPEPEPIIEPELEAEPELEPEPEIIEEEIVEPEPSLEEMFEAPVEPEPVPEPQPVQDDFDENAYNIYETKEAAIVTLCLPKFNEKSSEEEQDFLDLLRRYNRYFLHTDEAVAMAARGEAFFGAFENPNTALTCARGYLNILRDMKTDAYVGVNWGSVTSCTSADSDAKDLIINSITPMARLKPLAEPGEVLVLDELYRRPEIKKDNFEFEKVSRKWTKTFSENGPSFEVLCYSVKEASGE